MFIKPEIEIPKTAIIGANSFIGKYFFEAYSNYFSNIIGTSRRNNQKYYHLDLLRPDISKIPFIETQHTEALILAAVPRIEQCASDPITTNKINVDGTLKLIRELHQRGIKPIFVSTDYVFDGAKGYYTENDTVCPNTEYGRQKAVVEEEIQKICGDNYLIIRIGKTFSLTRGDNTIFDEMASKLSKNETVCAAFDQVFCPLLIDDLIHSLLLLQSQQALGIYHICVSEGWSRFQFAITLAQLMNKPLHLVQKISLDDLPNQPKRPKNTSLSNAKIQHECSVSFHSINNCLQKIAENWKE